MARRFLFIALIALLLTTSVAHLYSYLRVRRIQTILSALSKIEVDKSTEADLTKAMPYLTRCSTDVPVRPSKEYGDVESGLQRCYYIAVRTDRDHWSRFEQFASQLGPTHYVNKSGNATNWVLTLARVLGYRYTNFGASVVLLNGRVSSVRYGIADHLVFPEILGDIVSARSVHAYWQAYQRGAPASSVTDEAPDFRVTGNDDWGLNVNFTPDAPADLKAHAFSLDLRCFWGMRSCYAGQVAASVLQDKTRLEAAAWDRLQSNNPCPDRIIAERMKYFPDINVLLLEYTGSENARPTSSPYKLVAVLRGRAFGVLGDTNVQGSAPGQQFLAFSGPRFNSCLVVPAAPTALAIVQNTPKPTRRAEDEIVNGIQ